MDREDIQKEYLAACFIGNIPRANSLQLKIDFLSSGDSWKVDDGKEYDDTVIRKDGFISTKEYGGAEVCIANYVLANQRYYSGIKVIDVEDLGLEQISAIEGLSACEIACLQGPPGSGKTKTIKKLVSLFRGKSVALCAPTGRAAKRIRQSTGFNAVTCHRLLGYKLGQFLFNEFNKLTYEIIICDEASMLGVDLAAYLFRACKEGTRIYFVGDVNQLPSVTPGNFFSDMQSICPTFKLDKIYRYDNDGAIGEACRIINEGGNLNDISDISFGKGIGVFTRNAPWHTSRKWVLNSVNHMFMSMGVKPHDVRVCAPDNKTVFGLNKLLEFTFGGEGLPSPYMQTRNDYDIDISNGEVGISIDGGKTIDFGEGGIIQCTWSMVLAWATTIHKQQGCECDGLILALPPRSCGMITRNLLYTAISRCKRMFFACGDLDTMNVSLARTIRRRLTRLWALGKR